MSCYFRHMKETLAAAGITITDTNKRAVDQAIHQMVGVPYKACSPTWQKVRSLLTDERKRTRFVTQLKKKGHHEP